MNGCYDRYPVLLVLKWTLTLSTSAANLSSSVCAIVSRLIRSIYNILLGKITFSEPVLVQFNFSPGGCSVIRFLERRHWLSIPALHGSQEKKTLNHPCLTHLHGILHILCISTSNILSHTLLIRNYPHSTLLLLNCWYVI